MNYFDTQGIPFRPAVRVRPVGRWFEPAGLPHLPGTNWVRVRVTSRFTGECGAIRDVRLGALYARQGVSRGTCGRLCWEGRMPDAEYMALPVVTP